MSRTETQNATDPNRGFLLNSHRTGVARNGRPAECVRKMEALTTYRDQLRAELAGVDAELTALASGHFASAQ
ncbi:MAG: hypothetical protein ACKVT1_09660 [Dehalococcoidia bacterium]